MKKISQVEYDILNVLYFPEPLENILEEVNADRNVISDVLKRLIDKKLVTAMIFDTEKKDFVKSFIYDTDNMDDYHYLITKEGLLLHTNSVIEPDAE